MRQDLGTFTVRVFQTICPGDRYLHNWHIDAIAYALLQVHEAASGDSSSPNRLDR